MKKLLFVLVPLAVFAQVEVDTVIRFPGGVGDGCFFPELNKLYVDDYPDGYFVLDCSTYQLEPGIPTKMTFGHYSYNWRRQKLYVTYSNGPDSTLVIDVAGDSVLGWLELFREWHSDVYLGDVDRRYKPAVDTLYEYDCTTDTVTRRLPIYCTRASWDSVGRKLYVGQGTQKKLYVYDYMNDSCLRVIDVSSIPGGMADACVFSRTRRRAYVSSGQFELSYARVGIVDTERDTLLRVLPVRVRKGLRNQVVVNERDGKVYMTDCDGDAGTPDTMWVIDCATDSVLKKFECVRAGHTDQFMCWVPWSNRIYLINTAPDATHKSSLVVIDCNADSVIVPGMLPSVGDGCMYDIQLDPIRQRVFVTGGDVNTVYVLRDTGYEGVNEADPTGPRLTSGLQVQPTSAGYEVSYSTASTCWVDVSIYDLAGREIRRLVAEEQSAGEHRATWNCRDGFGSPVPRGAYLIRLDTPGFRAVKKAVVTR